MQGDMRDGPTAASRMLLDKTARGRKGGSCLTLAQAALQKSKRASPPPRLYSDALPATLSRPSPHLHVVTPPSPLPALTQAFTSPSPPLPLRPCRKLLPRRFWRRLVRPPRWGSCWDPRSCSR